MSEFGSINLDDVVNEGERLDNAGGGSFLDQFVPMPQVKQGQVGSVVIRILPPAKGSRLYIPTRVHTLNGRKVHCPRPLVNGKWDRTTECCICDYYSALWRKADKLEDAGNKEEAEKLKNEARSIKPIERYYYNAMVRSLMVDGSEQKNVGPRILSVGKILHKMIVRAMIGDETEKGLGDITDVKAGYDFIIKKELRGTGDNAFPNYDQSKFAREPSVLGDPEQIAEWAANLHDLTKLRNVKENEHLEKELAIHRGLLPDDAEGFNIDEFDAKYANDAQGEINELMEAGEKTQVAVAANVTADASTEVAAQTTEPDVVSEVADEVGDVQIDDEEFLAELEEMG